MDWHIDPRRSDRAPYLQIVDAIERGVGAAMLRPGDRLPAQRTLASQLGVDLTTVTRAYREAGQRGLIEARGAAGSFVAPPRVAQTQLVDLSMNIPPQPEGIDLRSRLARGLSQVVARIDIDTLMTYHHAGGHQGDCKAAATWLKPMLGKVNPGRIVVTPGAQAALAALLLATTRAGSTVLVEPLVYPGIRSAAQRLDRRLQAVACDADGMCPDALGRQLHALAGDALIYLNPTASNPTAHTMPLARREALVHVARKHATLLIEDDPYSRFVDAPPPAFATLMPEATCHVATLSKNLTPGLRTAHVVLPDRVDRDAVIDALRAMLVMAPPVMTALATQWLLDGTADALLHQVTHESRLRRDIALNLFTGIPGVRCEALHLWLPLPSQQDADRFLRAASDAALAVAPADAFAADAAAAHPGARISLGPAHSRGELTSALRRLQHVLHATGDQVPRAI